MTTKDYLSQIDRLEKMVQNKLTEIYQLKTMACSVTVSNDGERVQTSGDKDQIGAVVAKIIDLEADVDAMIDKRCAIVNQIDSMEDTKTYDILAKRYILRKSINELAEERDITFRHMKRLIYEAEKEFENKYGENYIGNRY